jgi:hypothetical protein
VLRPTTTAAHLYLMGGKPRGENPVSSHKRLENGGVVSSFAKI